MKIGKHIRLIFSLAVITAFVLSDFSFSHITDSYAADSGDKTLSLTLRCAYDGTAVANVPFSMYKVETISEKNEVVVTDDFQKYDVDYENLSQEQAGILTGYAQRDNLKPLCTGKTGEDGTLVFQEEKDNLTAGIYLVVGEPVETETLKYTSDPFLISLPGVESISDGGYKYVYAVEADPKFSAAEMPKEIEETQPPENPVVTEKPSTTKPAAETDEPAPTPTQSPVVTEKTVETEAPVVTEEPSVTDEPEATPEPVEVTVVKVWKDNDNESSSRPSKIKVQLLKDGEVYATKTLNEENSWRHTWTGLDASAEWNIVEKSVPDGYKVSYSKDGTTYKLKNKLEDTKEKTSTENKDENLTEEEKYEEALQELVERLPLDSKELGDPEVPTTYANPDGTSSSTGSGTSSTLPQTGLCWWPVPFLLVAGMFLFICGIIRRRKGES